MYIGIKRLIVSQDQMTSNKPSDIISILPHFDSEFAAVDGIMDTDVFCRLKLQTVEH
jgi:hypothetical protein